jgi:hypothetical protein
MDYYYTEDFKGAIGSGTGAVVAGVGAASMSNSGSGNMERCPIDDTSFYCRLSKFVNIIGMLVYLIFIVIFAVTFFYYAYVFLSAMSKSKGKSK